MSLTVPKAPTIGGRAAQLRFEEDQTGDTVARLGMTMLQVGERIAAEQEQRGLGKARVAIAQRLNDLQQQGQQIGDPDELDRFGASEFQRARQEAVDAAPPAIRDQVGQIFDEQAISHKARLGGRGIELRQSQELANLSALGQEVVRTVSIADAETQAASRAQYDAQLDSLIQRGVIAPDQAERVRQQFGGQMETARAQRMLSEDPDALVAAIDAGDFAVMGGDAAQGWRARGVAASAANTARADAAAKVERTERLKVASDLAKDGTAVLRTGQPFARDDELRGLLSDPEISALPEMREYAATAILAEKRPELASLPLSKKKELLAEIESQPITKDYEADTTQALKDLISAETTALAKDPLGHFAKTLKLDLPALPDPATVAPDELGAALRTRRHRAEALIDNDYISASDVKIFTPAEREQWSALAKREASPQTRAAIAQNMASALGPMAPRAMAEISDDPAFVHVGNGLAHGMDQRLAWQVFDGLRVIEEKQVRLPSVPQRRQAFFSEFSGLFPTGTDQQWKDQAGMRDRVIAAADGLYAYRMRGKVAEGGASYSSNPELAVLDRDAYLQAVHDVLGGTGSFNSADAKGGVQVVNGALTFMPADATADGIEERLKYLGQGGGVLGWHGLSKNGVMPSIGGELPDATTMEDVRLRALPDGSYLLIYDNGKASGPSIVMGDDGKPYQLNMRAFMAVAP